MNNIDRRTDKRKVGDLGEDIACKFLEKHGFKIVERNYLRKWGELDIVAKKDDTIRFIEVKSINRHTISNGTHVTNSYRPEDNMHPWKLKRLGRAIQTYLLHPPERLFSRAGKKQEINWQLDLITVQIDMDTRKARVEMIENIVI